MYNSIFLFMNMGTPEILMILFVVLLLFGGKKLPELARGLGKGIREFKDASDGVKREIHNNINNVNDGMDLNHTPSRPESYGNTPNYNSTPNNSNTPNYNNAPNYNSSPDYNSNPNNTSTPNNNNAPESENNLPGTENSKPAH